jgi:hypothetical protein
MCFDRFEITDLDITEDGKPQDVCKPCAEADREAIRRLVGRVGTPRTNQP